MRSYDEVVIVRTHGRTCPGCAGTQHREVGEPESFVWRGRRYRVQAVLDRWVRRRPWWRSAFQAPARGAHGARAADARGVPHLSSVPGAPGSWGEPGASGASEGFEGSEGSVVSEASDVRAVLADLEQDVWRVEAVVYRSEHPSGPARPVGVYDLLDRGGQAPDRWRLIAVAD